VKSFRENGKRMLDVRSFYFLKRNTVYLMQGGRVVARMKSPSRGLKRRGHNFRIFWAFESHLKPTTRGRVIAIIPLRVGAGDILKFYSARLQLYRKKKDQIVLNIFS
jgi:hypothetical protein